MDQTRPSIDTLRVVLIGDGEWRGTFAEFVENNADGFSILEIQEMADALMRGERVVRGGGAAPVFVLRREDAP
jgi:hypothetical protein